MAFEIEYTDEFGEWWANLTLAEQEDVQASVGLLEARGPALGFPHSSQIKGSDFGCMRELRVQHKGKPYRILYAFDPIRHGILLLGGNKTGNNRWYIKYVPIADELYRQHLEELQIEAQGQGER